MVPGVGRPGRPPWPCVGWHGLLTAHRTVTHPAHPYQIATQDNMHRKMESVVHQLLARSAKVRTRARIAMLAGREGGTCTRSVPVRHVGAAPSQAGDPSFQLERPIPALNLRRPPPSL